MSFALFSLTLSPDGEYRAIGTGGGTNPAGAEGSTNNAYVMKLPVK